MEAVVPPLFTVMTSGPPLILVVYRIATLKAVPLAICVAWINVLPCVSVTVGAVPLPTPTHTIMELPGLVANNPANRLATDPVLTLLALRMMEGVGGRTTVWASKSIVPMKSSRNAHRIIFQVIHGPKLVIPSMSLTRLR